MKPRAIVIGALTDVFCTKLFMLALLVVLLDPGSSSQAPIERVDSYLLECFCLTWGVFFTGLGGFVAGRLAPFAPELHGALVGVVSLVISHVFYGWSPAAAGMTFYCCGSAASLSLALLGGRLARLKW